MGENMVTAKIVRMPGRIQMGGGHNLIKRGKNAMDVHVKTPHFSTLQLPGPPPPPPFRNPVLVPGYIMGR